MTAHENIAFKNKLRDLGMSILRDRLTNITSLMDSAQQAANSEEKSSAGDKYETGRAINQLEKEMYARQQQEVLKDISALRTIETGTVYAKAGAGAVVTTKEEVYFIFSGLGKQQVDGHPFIFLSANAPLARALYGHAAGDTIHFNNRNLELISVY